MRGGNQPDAAFGNRPCRFGLGFRPDLIHHNDFGHMIFDRFDHDLVLTIRGGDLHPSGAPDSGVGNISVAGNFI